MLKHVVAFGAFGLADAQADLKFTEWNFIWQTLSNHGIASCADFAKKNILCDDDLATKIPNPVFGIVGTLRQSGLCELTCASEHMPWFNDFLSPLNYYGNFVEETAFWDFFYNDCNADWNLCGTPCYVSDMIANFRETQAFNPSNITGGSLSQCNAEKFTNASDTTYGLCPNMKTSDAHSFFENLVGKSLLGQLILQDSIGKDAQAQPGAQEKPKSSGVTCPAHSELISNHNQLLVSNKQNNEVFVLGSLEVAQAVYTDCWPCVAQNYELCSVHALSCSVDALQNNETCSFGGAQLLSKCGFPANVTIAGAINGTAQFNLFCEKYVTHDTTPAPDDDTTPAPYIKIKLPATCETEANKHVDAIEKLGLSVPALVSCPHLCEGVVNALQKCFDKNFACKSSLATQSSIVMVQSSIEIPEAAMTKIFGVFYDYHNHLGHQAVLLGIADAMLQHVGYDASKASLQSVCGYKVYKGDNDKEWDTCADVFMLEQQDGVAVETNHGSNGQLTNGTYVFEYTVIAEDESNYAHTLECQVGMVVKKENDDREFTIHAIMVETTNEDGSKSWIRLVELAATGIITRFDGSEELLQIADSADYSDLKIQGSDTYGYKDVELLYLLVQVGTVEDAPVSRNTFMAHHTLYQRMKNVTPPSKDAIIAGMVNSLNRNGQAYSSTLNYGFNFETFLSGIDITVGVHEPKKPVEISYPIITVVPAPTDAEDPSDSSTSCTDNCSNAGIMTSTIALASALVSAVFFW